MVLGDDEQSDQDPDVNEDEDEDHLGARAILLARVKRSEESERQTAQDRDNNKLSTTAHWPSARGHHS